MLDLQRRGLGTASGVPTLVIAAASIDDVYAITAFSVFLTIAFSTGLQWSHCSFMSPCISGDLLKIIALAPLEVIGGVTIGIAVGELCTTISFKFSRDVLMAPSQPSAVAIPPLAILPANFDGDNAHVRNGHRRPRFSRSNRCSRRCFHSRHQMEENGGGDVRSFGAVQ
jgi:hypothetical protein